MVDKPKRHYHHNHEHKLYKRLKFIWLAIILIPALALGGFVFFGPVIGNLFGIVSVNRNNTGKGDTLAPPVPIFDNPPRAVNSDSITLKGFGEPGSTIRLFANGPEIQSNVTTNDGTFTFENVELIEGRNTIFAKAVDTNNNESEKSTTLNIIKDKENPDITVDEPKDGETVKNLNRRIFIRGSVSEKVTLKINDKFAILKPDLSFEFPLGVDEGWTEIKIVAKDEAGNENEETFKVNYEKSTE